MSKWPWIWSIWLLLIVVSFAALEGLAWQHGETLSRFIWNLSEEWPLFIWIAGVISGGLAVHFWWHWSPPGSKSEG